MAGLFHLIHHPLRVAHSLRSDLRTRQNLVQIAVKHRPAVFNSDIRGGASGIVDESDNRIRLVDIAPIVTSVV